MILLVENDEAQSVHRRVIHRCHIEWLLLANKIALLLFAIANAYMSWRIENWLARALVRVSCRLYSAVYIDKFDLFRCTATAIACWFDLMFAIFG